MSFDCTPAKSSTEKIVCADPGLSKAAERLAAGYSKTTGVAAGISANDAKELKQHQRDWLKDTAQACKDRTCLASADKKRIAIFGMPSVTQSGTLEALRIANGKAKFSIQLRR